MNVPVPVNSLVQQQQQQQQQQQSSPYNLQDVSSTIMLCDLLDYDK